MEVQIEYLNLAVASDFGSSELKEVISLQEKAKYEDLIKKLIEKYQKVYKSTCPTCSSNKVETREIGVEGAKRDVYSNFLIRIPDGRLATQIEEELIKDKGVLIMYKIGGG